MWTFRQSTGLVEDFNGHQYTGSYAGHGEGKNNPVLQDVRAGCRLQGDEWVAIPELTGDDWGPLPQGIYTINSPVDTTTHGPYVLWLTPGAGNEMFGRSGFGWHGDSKEHPGLASEGCICSPRQLRELVWNSNDHRVQVIL